MYINDLPVVKTLRSLAFLQNTHYFHWFSLHFHFRPDFFFVLSDACELEGRRMFRNGV